MLTALLMLLACQEPFGTDRHHLEGFRVAAASATPEDSGWRATAALVVDGRLWSDEAVSLRWYALESIEALEALDVAAPPDATGPVGHLPASAVGIGLIATSPAGVERRVWLQPTAEVIELTDVTVEHVQGVTVDGLTAADLSVDSRSSWLAEPATTIPAGEVATLSAVVGGAPLRLARWMQVGEPGQLLELDADSATWIAGSVLVDDEEILERSIAEPGPVTVLALALSQGGSAAFRAEELWVGPPSPGLMTSSGRWLGTDSEVAGDLVRGRLIADDEAPTGLSLVEVEPLAALPDSEDPWGTAALACEDVSGAFDPSWLLDGRCTRGAVVDQIVVVSR